MTSDITFKMRTYTRKKLQMQQIEDMQSLCRLCLGKTGEMMLIFDDNVENIFSILAMRINMCLGLEVSRDDTLPKFICQLCNSKLNKFYTFKSNCAATYRKLKATLNTVNNIENKNVDNKSTEINISTVSDKCEDINETILIDSSESVIQSVQSINKSFPEEENISDRGVSLEKNEKNSKLVIELKTEKQDSHKPSYSSDPTELTSHDTQKSEDDIEQVQIDENRDMYDSIKTVECLPTHIVTSLIEKGVLAKREEGLQILSQNIKTFYLETANGSEIIMELVEEEPEIPMDEPSKTTRPKVFDSNLTSDARCCGTCGVRLSSRGALVRHARVHTGEKPFPCRTCGRRFAQREVLRRHELLHSDKLPYQCDVCPKAYTQRGALEAHARSHAPPDSRPLVLHRCSRCPKVFLYPSGLSRHMSVHQGQGFPCEECSRTFNDKSSLQRHRRSHQRSRPDSGAAGPLTAPDEVLAARRSVQRTTINCTGLQTT